MGRQAKPSCQHNEYFVPVEICSEKQHERQDKLCQDLPHSDCILLFVVLKVMQNERVIWPDFLDKPIDTKGNCQFGPFIHINRSIPVLLGLKILPKSLLTKNKMIYIIGFDLIRFYFIFVIKLANLLFPTYINIYYGYLKYIYNSIPNIVFNTCRRLTKYRSKSNNIQSSLAMENFFSNQKVPDSIKTASSF